RAAAIEKVDVEAGPGKLLTGMLVPPAVAADAVNEHEPRQRRAARGVMAVIERVTIRRAKCVKTFQLSRGINPRGLFDRRGDKPGGSFDTHFTQSVSPSAWSPIRRGPDRSCSRGRNR